MTATHFRYHRVTPEGPASPACVRAGGHAEQTLKPHTTVTVVCSIAVRSLASLAIGLATLSNETMEWYPIFSSSSGSFVSRRQPFGRYTKPLHDCYELHNGDNPLCGDAARWGG